MTWRAEIDVEVGGVDDAARELLLDLLAEWRPYVLRAADWIRTGLTVPAASEADADAVAQLGSLMVLEALSEAELTAGEVLTRGAWQASGAPLRGIGSVQPA